MASRNVSKDLRADAGARALAGMLGWFRASTGAVPWGGLLANISH